MLVAAAGLLLGALLLVIAVGVLLPSRLVVARAQLVEVPPERIFPWLNELKLWPGWTVWNRSDDPTLSFTYPSATSGLAASMHWMTTGADSGSLIITRLESNRLLGYELRLLTRAVVVQGRIELQPGESGTRVSWRDEIDLGSNPLRKIAGPFVARAQGRACQRNLAGLAAAALTGRAGGPGA